MRKTETWSNNSSCCYRYCRKIISRLQQVILDLWCILRSLLSVSFPLLG